MTDRDKKGATGFQIAFLIVALLLVGEAADRYVFRPMQLDMPTGRIMTFIFAGVILFGVPALRRWCWSLLAVPIPPHKRKEVAIVFALQINCAFAVVGAAALWWWSTGGEPALARHMGQNLGLKDPWGHAFSTHVLVKTFLVGAVLAPFIEELAFRGILYRTWEAQWGWVKSTFATSIVFALIHPYVIPQFFASLVLICLFRRTGSLLACVLVHSLMNIAIWHPLIGQFLFPAGRETGEIAVWGMHLGALAVAVVAVPLYLWMARDEKAAVAPLPAEIAGVRA